MEADFLRWLRERLPPHPLLKLGIGDDAAILATAGRGDIVVTTDLIADGVDFDLHSTIRGASATRRWPSI